MVIFGVQDAAHKRKVEAAKTERQAEFGEPDTERDSAPTKNTTPGDLQKQIIDKI